MHSISRLRLLSPDECDRSVSLVEDVKPVPAQERGGVFTGRGGFVGWIPLAAHSQWLFDRMGAYGRQYAAATDIDVSGLLEPLEYVEYPTGASFDWHIDAGTRATRNRKVTISVQLSNAGEYDGGNLELVGEERGPLARAKGNAIAFAAALGHRVTTVNRGTRRALVGWMLGPPFR